MDVHRCSGGGGQSGRAAGMILVAMRQQYACDIVGTLAQFAEPFNDPGRRSVGPCVDDGELVPVDEVINVDLPVGEEIRIDAWDHLFDRHSRLPLHGPQRHRARNAMSAVRWLPYIIASGASWKL